MRRLAGAGRRLRRCGPYGKDRRIRGRIPSVSHPARRCRSSVVEHSLGKGEVVSSILTGSTRKRHCAPEHGDLTALVCSNMRAVKTVIDSQFGFPDGPMSALHPLQMFAVRNGPADAILMTGGTLSSPSETACARSFLHVS